jgi:predicted acetyltransferase
VKVRNQESEVRDQKSDARLLCHLVTPSLEHLPGYRDALERGWSPDNISPERTAKMHLARIADDPGGFVAGLYDPEARGAPLLLPDGTSRKRLPGMFLWVWDGAFCGSFSLRWQNGTAELPDYCLGHIGYSIVPWKRRRGYATVALAGVLREAKSRGLDHVLLTADPENLPSQKVITANGGRPIGTRRQIDAYGGTEDLCYRIDL